MSVRPLKRLKQSWKNSLLWLTKPRLRNRKHQVIRYKIIDQPSSNLSSLRFLYHSFSRSFSSCKELYEKGKSVHRFDHKVPLSHAACYIFFYLVVLDLKTLLIVTLMFFLSTLYTLTSVCIFSTLFSTHLWTSG